MLDWHLGMVEGEDGRETGRLSAADAVTLARLWLVPVVFGGARSACGLPSVVVIGAASDWADGKLARRHGRTRLGRDLDATVDLAFVSSVAVAARSARRITPAAHRALMARQLLA